MKRYQLIGRKRTAERRLTPEYKRAHIHSLPLELLIQIFSFVAHDPSQLLNLCLVCQKFNSIISKHFLYRLIRFNDVNTFLTFTRTHLPSKRGGGVNDISTKVNFIQAIEFVNPPIKESKDCQTKIAGSYDVEGDIKTNNRVTFDEFTVGLRALIRDNYNLKQITITEISPQFAFDDLHDETSSFLKRNKRAPKRTLQKLVLKAQTGWSILFKLNHLSHLLNVYDSINELELHNFIIDGVKLSNMNFSKPITINSLKLFKCSLLHRNPRGSYCELFKNTTCLKMVDIVKSSDLSIIDFIKSNNQLHYLSIDLGSPIFSENSKFNFRAFNPFFKLICSRNGNYSHINVLVLDDFDLLSQYTHDHEEHGSSVKKNEDLTELLGFLSAIPLLVIKVKFTQSLVHTCKKCGFLKTEEFTPIEKLSERDWTTLLKPLIDNKSHFKIINHKLETLFEVT